MVAVAGVVEVCGALGDVVVGGGCVVVDGGEGGWVGCRAKYTAIMTAASAAMATAALLMASFPRVIFIFGGR